MFFLTDLDLDIALALAVGQPHSIEHGSVESELIACASHTHDLFRDDNSYLYYLLEEATQDTPYATSIKPFQRAKDGRGALVALTHQYAWKDKWEAEIKKQEQLLQRICINVGMCRTCSIQLPNEHSHVGFLLDAIQSADARLQAALASIKTDNGLNGMQNNFEQAAAHLLPYDPVAKKRATGIKHGSALISLTEAKSEPIASIAANDAKPSIGKTGVTFNCSFNHWICSSSHASIKLFFYQMKYPTYSSLLWDSLLFQAHKTNPYLANRHPSLIHKMDQIKYLIFCCKLFCSTGKGSVVLHFACSYISSLIVS